MSIGDFDNRLLTQVDAANQAALLEPKKAGKVKLLLSLALITMPSRLLFYGLLRIETYHHAPNNCTTDSLMIDPILMINTIINTMINLNSFDAGSGYFLLFSFSSSSLEPASASG